MLTKSQRSFLKHGGPGIIDALTVVCQQIRTTGPGPKDWIGDVITGGNVKTIEGYVMLNFEIASISSFRENLNQPFV